MKTDNKARKMVKVKFKNSKYNYTTSVNPQSSDEELEAYFVGNILNVGLYPDETLAICTGIEINNKF